MDIYSAKKFLFLLKGTLQLKSKFILKCAKICPIMLDIFLFSLKLDILFASSKPTPEIYYLCLLFILLVSPLLKVESTLLLHVSSV